MAKAASSCASIVLGGSLQLGQRRSKLSGEILVEGSVASVSHWSLGIGSISGQSKASGPQPSECLATHRSRRCQES
jgi:hypothetical protein